MNIFASRRFLFRSSISPVKELHTATTAIPEDCLIAESLDYLFDDEYAADEYEKLLIDVLMTAKNRYTRQSKCFSQCFRTSWPCWRAVFSASNRTPVISGDIAVRQPTYRARLGAEVGLLVALAVPLVSD